jgi:hypothetical protein
MTGVEMMLGTLLKSLGIKIDPSEIEAKFNEVKDSIPVFARRATELLSSIDSRLTAIETRLTAIEQRQAATAEPETEVLTIDTGTNKPN